MADGGGVVIKAETWLDLVAYNLAALADMADAEDRELAETGRVLRDAAEPPEDTE